MLQQLCRHSFHFYVYQAPQPDGSDIYPAAQRFFKNTLEDGVQKTNDHANSYLRAMEATKTESMTTSNFRLYQIWDRTCVQTLRAVSSSKLKTWSINWCCHHRVSTSTLCLRMRNGSCWNKMRRYASEHPALRST